MSGQGSSHPAAAFLRLARPMLPPLGGVLLLLGERLLASAPTAPWLSGAGLLLIVLAAGGTARMMLRREPSTQAASDTEPPGGPDQGFDSGLSTGGEQKARREAGGGRLWALAPHLLLVAGGVLSLLTPDAASPGPVRDLMQWAWVLCLLTGAVMYVFVEHALWRQPAWRQGAPGSTEWRRVAWAGAGGFTLALLLALVVVINFAFNTLGLEWNLAYFRTTQPSAATREVALELPEHVSVGVFFTLDSTVAPLMRGYFDALTADPVVAKQLRVERVDAQLNPDIAEQYKVNGNGWIVLRRGDTRATLFVGDQFSQARANLLKFDQTFFGKLLEMAQPRRTAYFTVGHRERNENSAGPAPEGVGFSAFQTLLRGRNYKTSPLGLEQGLGTEIPEDAQLVVIAGPELPFRPAELESLARYLERGGRLLAFLEPGEALGKANPDGKGGKDAPLHTLADLLARYGAEFKPEPLANDRFYGRRTFTKADHALLVTVRYQNHPAVATLRAAANQFPLLLLNSGSLRKLPVNLPLNVQEVVKAMPGTWGDGNGNFTFDAPGESRGDPVLALASWPAKQPAPPAGKTAGTAQGSTGPIVFVFADTDVASDLLMGNRANRQALETIVAWITGNPSKAPAYPTSEEDVRITHAKADDWLWFYLPVFGVPLLVLLFGFWRSGRSRLRREVRHG